MGGVCAGMGEGAERGGGGGAVEVSPPSVRRVLPPSDASSTARQAPTCTALSQIVAPSRLCTATGVPHRSARDRPPSAWEGTTRRNAWHVVPSDAGSTLSSDPSAEPVHAYAGPPVPGAHAGCATPAGVALSLLPAASASSDRRRRTEESGAQPGVPAPHVPEQTMKTNVVSSDVAARVKVMEYGKDADAVAYAGEQEVAGQPDS